MSLLINELLAFSKASIRGVDIELTPVNVFTVLSSVVSKVDSNHNVNISVDPALYVLAEPVLFERAVSNILRNSVRYAGPSGPIEVTAECTKSEVLLAVLDNGPGMPPEAIKMLGQPFFRLEPSRNRQSGGVGLGLAIVKTCIESCGGTFRASNRTPRGLKVELRLVRSSAPGTGRISPKDTLELDSEDEPSVEAAAT
jgi:two-component system sensor histidine kinase CpxA